MSFAADVSRWCKETAPKTNEKIIKTVVMEVANRVIFRSPVGDPSVWQSPPPPGYAGGRFRANWIYGFGSAPTNFSDAIDPSGAKTLGDIISRVATQKASGVHWIANNLPYAERIENGWSAQAPQGVVGLVEMEFGEIFDRARAQA